MTGAAHGSVTGWRQAHRFGDLVMLVACIAMLTGFVVTTGRSAYGAPPDFSAMPVEQKKQAFFAYLSPLVTGINSSLAEERKRVQAIRAAYLQGREPGWLDRRWLASLARRLEVPIDELPLDEALALLERRSGSVPESLVLAQAAIESGWGTSRFALEGNNYFGQRCYESGCGIAPLGRPDDAGFGLARFDSAAASIESYIMNLNTHPEYRDFRVRRQALRDAGTAPTGLALLSELDAYSERGDAYIAEVRAMIQANDLE